MTPADDLLASMLPYFGCVMERTPDGFRLSGAGRNHMNSAAITARCFKAPFTVRLVGKTDSTNLRLYWHLGEIILNWECSVRQLRVHDPATGQQWGIDDQGFVSIDAWHEIEWEIKRDAMQLRVDGRPRFACEGGYGAIDAPLGVGPCFGSTVTVREFTVREG